MGTAARSTIASPSGCFSPPALSADGPGGVSGVTSKVDRWSAGPEAGCTGWITSGGGSRGAELV
jgi:hypothetical protein